MGLGSKGSIKGLSLKGSKWSSAFVSHLDPSSGKNLWKMYQDGQSGFVTDQEQTRGIAVGEVVAITGCCLAPKP